MIHQITTQIAPITNHQFYIQAALILAVIAAGWMMLRTPGGARHQAARRLATLAFVVFAEQGGSGSQIAAPIAAKVLTACKTMLDTPNPNS